MADEKCKLCAYCNGLREQETKGVEIDTVKPLTLDELREMDGEPVYCVHPQKSCFNGWGIVYDVCVDGYNANFEISDYGKTWFAYRHKPKEVSYRDDR